jgi:phosphatidylserine synthase
MGKEMDSLSDSLTFGIAPAILTFQAFKTGTIFDIVIIIGAICFVFGAILRLARFNISEVPGYTGVPTPISALLLITYFYFNYFYAFGMGGNNYPFPEVTSYLIPIFMVFIAWFNITTYIKFGEKDKVIYLTFIIVAPLCPILGTIGILSPNPLISMICSVFFLGSFILILIVITRGFFLNITKNKSG